MTPTDDDLPLGTLGPITIQLVNDQGDVVEGEVELRRRDGATTIEAFAEEGGQTALELPVATSATGELLCWVVPGPYEWRATSGGETLGWRPLDVADVKESVVPLLGSTPISALQDDFSAETLDPHWTDHAESIGIVDGRLAIPLEGGTVMIRSDAIYELRESALFFELELPEGFASGGPSTENILFSIEGRGSVISVRIASDGLQLVSAILPYDPVEHRWLRFRHTGGVVYIEASPTGQLGTWTTLESADTVDFAGPDVSWYPTDVRLTISASAPEGSGLLDPFAYIDNINVPPPPG